ncbi:endonuclease NucS domain-containing protein [Deinococcus humi]|uniref:Endonuclease NucS C-terminal domain-containing protein n=1 Tax=Deinococcus humi TaxID=662880 RepID=A0A7W8JVC6_9DEIO|nr:endonuclease NucS domain-containing protein [Deinococcus humi]MBB5363920.1 hypothetical protein [Deinococcus humi]GGO40617.1 hypothetical protein GCM10008949_50330 [Deinococcus humi]
MTSNSLPHSGSIDLYACAAQVELKRGRATRDPVIQLGCHVATMQKSGVQMVQGILAAPSIPALALKELRARGLAFREIGAWPMRPRQRPSLPPLFD